MILVYVVYGHITENTDLTSAALYRSGGQVADFERKHRLS